MLRILVNGGEEYTLQLEPRRLLLQALRDDIGLIGTKEGCNIGVCGGAPIRLVNNVLRRNNPPLNKQG